MLSKNAGEYIQSFGTVLTLIGVLRVIQYAVLKLNPSMYEKMKVSCEDERSDLIQLKTCRLTFMTCIYGACAAVIISSITGHGEVAVVISYCLSAVVAVFYIYKIILDRIN